MNIALVNELKVVFDRMGIDVWEVIEAAKTKPFGFMPFYPGPGLGGHCIPLDPFYLTWKAAEHGVWARFIELAGEINTAHAALRRRPDGQAPSTRTARASRGRRSSSSASRYKADIDDDRESPSFEIIELLRASAAPRSRTATRTSPSRAPAASTTSASRRCPAPAEEFARYDAVVVSTAHSDFKDAALFSRAKLVVDTRNLVASVGLPPGRGPEVVRA